MSMGILKTMLEALTSAYSLKDVRNAKRELPVETNIGRLFSTFSYGLEIVKDQGDKILLWDDLDVAEGTVLDRYAENFGVKRNGTSDEFLRLLIKVKMLSLLSGGDIDTVIRAAAALFNVDNEAIELRELFPAKIWVYVDEALLDETRLRTADIIALMMKRIVATGVGIEIIFRTYRTYDDTLVVNTGLSEFAEITIGPAVPDRRFTNPLYIGNATYEIAEIYLPSAN